MTHPITVIVQSHSQFFDINNTMKLIALTIPPDTNFTSTENENLYCTYIYIFSL